MSRLSPLVRLTSALVLLMLSLLVLAELLLDVFGQRDDEALRLRQQLAATVSLQVAELVNREPPARWSPALGSLVQGLDGVRSVGVRGADGRLLADTGAHADAWPSQPGPWHQRFELRDAERTWGHVELVFHGAPPPWPLRWLHDPGVQLATFLALAGALAFGLYMRRALQHLDPAAVIPDRVQAAFDAMAEGVAVLDAGGRVLLVNRAFRQLHAQAPTLRTGQPLSAQGWLGSALPAATADHPWHRAMAAAALTTGDRLTLDADGAQPRHLVVNCAPIRDAGGVVRGCLATFEDVSALHRANDALRRAMEEAAAARDEVQRKNAELQRLATRDSLTGCLNRRALHEAVDALRQAQPAQPMAVLMIDIDHFKSINDTHGHAVGDRAIQEVARRLQDSVRATDLVSRWGGEEFCVVLPGLDAPRLAALAEQVRSRIERECGPGVREVPGLRITASLGGALGGAGPADLLAWVARADDALYRAKRGGRNRFEIDAPAPGVAGAPQPVSEAATDTAASGA